MTSNRHQRHMHDVLVFLRQHLHQAGLRRLGHGQREHEPQGLMHDGSRRHEQRRMRLGPRPGQLLQTRQHDRRGRVQSQIGDLEVFDNVLGRVAPEAAGLDARGVVDDHFGSADFGDGLLQGGGELVVLGHVGAVGGYGSGWGGGGDEGCVS